MDPFVETNRSSWERLAYLLKRVESSGLRSLAPEDLEDLGRLYRQIATHLAQARAERRDPNVIEHLNLLLGKAHAAIYTRRRKRSLRIGRFYATEFPRVFRRTFRYTAASFILFVGSAVLDYCLSVADPGWLEHTAPSGIEQAIGDFLEEDVPAGDYFARTQKQIGGSEAFSSFLWTHNLQVALLAFGLGIGACIGTVWALTTNGMMVGAALAVGALHGKLGVVYAMLAPHGVIELSAIILSGGAGFRLGWAVISPGNLSRRDALVIAARDAVKLILGTVPLFLLAGFIEGTITPITAEPFRENLPRILFGVATGVGLYAYLAAGDGLFGRFFGETAGGDEEVAAG